MTLRKSNIVAFIVGALLMALLLLSPSVNASIYPEIKNWFFRSNGNGGVIITYYHPYGVPDSELVPIMQCRTAYPYTRCNLDFWQSK